MKLLDVLLLALRRGASYRLLLGPAWLISVVEETEGAKSIVVY